MRSEKLVQKETLLICGKQGFRLFQNVRGMFWTLDKSRKIKAGLMADKSADLIGWRQITITPDMVGRTVAIFVSAEMKPEGWKKPKNEHERGQLEWARTVNRFGGFACIIDDEKKLSKLFDKWLRGK